MSKIRRHVFYSGIVQGVGFRFTAQQLALSYGLHGFVRNLPDGRVELVVEGREDSVEPFLAMVADRMASNIHDCAQSEEAVTGEFHGFDIRFG